jgi:transketolase
MTRLDPNEREALENTLAWFIQEYDRQCVPVLSAYVQGSITIEEQTNQCEKIWQRLFEQYQKQIQDLMLARARTATKKVLEELKQEMRMHTVPEGNHLITRSYLENTIDFKIAELLGEKPPQAFSNPP